MFLLFPNSKLFFFHRSKNHIYSSYHYSEANSTEVVYRGCGPEKLQSQQKGGKKAAKGVPHE